MNIKNIFLTLFISFSVLLSGCESEAEKQKKLLEKMTFSEQKAYCSKKIVGKDLEQIQKEYGLDFYVSIFLYDLDDFKKHFKLMEETNICYIFAVMEKNNQVRNNKAKYYDNFTIKNLDSILENDFKKEKEKIKERKIKNSKFLKEREEKLKEKIKNGYFETVEYKYNQILKNISFKESLECREKIIGRSRKEASDIIWNELINLGYISPEKDLFINYENVINKPETFVKLFKCKIFFYSIPGLENKMLAKWQKKEITFDESNNYDNWYIIKNEDVSAITKRNFEDSKEHYVAR